MRTLIILLLFFVWSCNSKNNLTSWIGKYDYSEEPIKANAGYNMTMFWDLSIRNENNEYKGELEIEGQQTSAKMNVKIEGDEKTIKVIFQTIKVIFQNISDGFGFGELKTGDILFRLTRKDNKIITTWNKLNPILIEKYKNDTVAFIKE